MSNDNIQNEILQDKINGKSQPWREKKIDSRKLSMSYYSVAHEVSSVINPSVPELYKHDIYSKRFVKRAYATEHCGDFLEFKAFDDGTMKLHSANFCKVRLCPMCAWRRSLKIFGQVSQIMNILEQTTDYEYIFVSLTQQNVSAVQLADELDNLFKAYGKLTYRTCEEFRAISKGWFRALEITHDVEPVITKSMYYKKRKYYDKRNLKIGDANPNYDMYHPHFHVIIAVDKHYFTSKHYLSTEKWAALWQRCLGVDYTPIVDARKVSKNSVKDDNNITYGKAVAEVSKYATKSADYLTDDRQETDKAVFTLDLALSYRRLIGFGGIFRKIQQQLKLDDAINGDLINTDGNDDIRPDVDFMIKRYSWNIGINNYTFKLERS